MAYPNYNKNSKEKYPWTGQVILNGKRKRKSFKTKKAALQWEAVQKDPEKEEKEKREEGTRSISLLEWATSYLEFATGKGGFAEKTVQEKQFAFRVMFKTLDADCEVNQLDPLLVLKHFQKQAKARSGNAANKDRKNLRAAWQWGIKYLKMPVMNPFATVDKFAEERHERHMPTLEDFWKVYDVCATDQDKLMLRMYLETGARREELFRLMWRDVDFKKNQVRLRWKKNQRGQWEEAWLPVRTEFMALLKQHQKITGLQKVVFLNMNGTSDPKQWVPYMYRQKWIGTLCKKAGVERFGIHGIRHLFASILAANNRPLVEIQFMLRHKHISTTQRYVHMLKKENREVLESLPDFGTRKKKSTESPLEELSVI